jgi:hypothetical protein
MHKYDYKTTNAFILNIEDEQNNQPSRPRGYRQRVSQNPKFDSTRPHKLNAWFLNGVRYNRVSIEV